MPVQTQHRFSVGDYYRMAETGVLRPGKRMELLDGKIIDMSPIGPFHGGIVNRLSRLFNQSSSNRWLVSTQNPLRLDDYSEPEPDVILLKPSADDYTHRHPQAQDVFLLIEVADSTLEYDREEKLPVYGRAGVPEVWTVNLTDAAIEILSRTTFHRLCQQSCFARGDKAVRHAFADVVVDVAELLKR